MLEISNPHLSLVILMASLCSVLMRQGTSLRSFSKFEDEIAL
jgi:hypothetical protein